MEQTLNEKIINAMYEGGAKSIERLMLQGQIDLLHEMDRNMFLHQGDSDTLEEKINQLQKQLNELV